MMPNFVRGTMPDYPLQGSRRMPGYGPEPAPEPPIRVGGTITAPGRTPAPLPRPIAPVLGQFKKGGIVPKTGAYKLHRGETVTPAGGKMTAAKRRSLPESEFALSKGHYPMDTKGRAKAALSRISHWGSSSQKATVRRRVHAKYPSMKMKSVSELKA